MTPWPTIRARLEPRASRVAISRRFPAARAERKLARFAQAIRRIKTTAPMRTRSEFPYWVRTEDTPRDPSSSGTNSRLISRASRRNAAGFACELSCESADSARLHRDVAASSPLQERAVRTCAEKKHLSRASEARAYEARSAASYRASTSRPARRPASCPKPFRHHADHSEWRVVQVYRWSHYRRVGREVRAPECVAEDDHARVPRSCSI